MNFAVFVSGSGTNLQAIINAVKKRKIRANIGLVVSDKKQAYALKRAKKAKIKSVFIDPKKFTDRKKFDREILKNLKKEKIDFLVLAGFMRILSPVLLKAYPNKILNIHPALLPAFRGVHAISDAFNYGVKTTGVTVHLVDEKVDHGPVILQEAVELKPKDTLASLEGRIHKVEHRLYPKAINLFISKRLKVAGRKVRVAI